MSVQVKGLLDFIFVSMLLWDIYCLSIPVEAHFFFGAAPLGCEVLLRAATSLWRATVCANASWVACLLAAKSLVR